LAFAPLLYHDAVRAARRSRYPLLRLYVYFILVNLLIGAMSWYLDPHGSNPVMPLNEAARIARGISYCFIGGQLLLIILVTPGYTASAIADEKERRTLEALLATDLANHEIVLSKLLVRIGNLLLMLLTGLPILMLLHFMGGVDADLALAGFAAAMLTTASLGALGMVNSVCCRRPRDAIFYTYLELALYLTASSLSRALFYTGFINYAVSWGGFSLSVADVVEAFCAANPILMLTDLVRLVAGGVPVAKAVWGALGDYALAHGVLMAVFVAWSTCRLRIVFVKHTYGETPRKRPRESRWSRRSVGNWPMIWKELIADRGFRFGWFGRTLLLLLIAGSFGSLGFIVWVAPWRPAPMPPVLGWWSRGIGAAVACLLLVGVAVRAAGSISSERERTTMDSLLASPLPAGAILLAKWLGSVTSVAWGWLWLGAVWGIGVLWGDLDILSVPLLFFAWCVYAGCLAVLGLWFSLTSSTSLRAIMYTLFSMSVLGLSFVALPFCFWSTTSAGTMLGRFADWLTKFLHGMTPPIALVWLLPVERALPGGRLPQEGWGLRFGFLGLACWIATTIVFAIMTYVYFAKRTARWKLKRSSSEQFPASPALNTASA
jgi:ABC-type transport system involved in multi-copper enzyme maturation permease subunit